ncbi:putative glycosyltransferasepolysaccharide [Mariniradius saccharolyticus AK6]|uniref:Glycosyltransferasepolysaccharide n=1 Tax=Mariniradius saccharolyticus AK6 TaxID=1239962 RepID=M7XUZ7_9BACT|nr:glycosyltransferase [Mariniradius saccharolyticus]EMS32307.1 putative glycosyltransferasepolysaccharide [Mariniradius saccharolyticus AK6]
MAEPISKGVLVSVCMITYNHERFVFDALDGVFQQKGNFQIQLIISDDCSADRTKEVIEEYLASKNNRHISVRFNSNLTNKGVFHNFFSTLGMAEGEFIAVCEGDDYWVDDYKIQKQIDYLKENPSGFAVFTNSFIINEFEKPGVRTFIPTTVKKRKIDPEEVFFEGGGLYPTASLLFRNFEITPPLQLRSHNSCDSILLFMLLSKGDILYLDDVTSVYRIHGGGAFSGIQKNDFLILEDRIKSIQILSYFRGYFDGRWHLEIDKAISNYSRLFLNRTSKFKAEERFLIRNLGIRDFLVFVWGLVKVYVKGFFDA